MKFSPFLEFNQVFANKTLQVMENHHGTVEQVAEAKLQQRLANATISDQAPIPTTLNLQLLHSNSSDSMQKIAVATQNKSSPANNTFNSQSHYIPQMSMPTIPPIPLPIITLNQRESHSVKSSASSNSISNNANPIDITSDRNECNYNLEPTFLNEQTQASRTANSSDCAITSGFKPVSSPVNIPTPSATEHEMRLLPWVDKQTPMHSTRIQRAITQKFVIINAKKTQRDERSYYIHSEQSGNKYTVIIGKIPHCDCPDYQNGNHCKHIIFVMVKVLHVSVTNKLILQQALLSSELMQLFENADEWRNIKKISKVDAKSASMESSLLTDDIMSYAISNKNSSQDLATNDHLPPSLAPPTTASPKEAKLNTRTINNLSSYSSDDLGKLMILLQNETKRRNMESPTKSLESKLNAFKCPLVKYTYPGTQFCDQFVHILALNDLINFTQTFDKSESLHEEPPQMTKEFELQLKSVADHPHILSNIKSM